MAASPLHPTNQRLARESIDASLLMRLSSESPPHPLLF